MPRIARKNYESCYFHVIVQGYEKEYIFEKDNWKKKYLQLLLREEKKFDVEILTYCIMGNHAHILLYCNMIEQMSLYMKNVNTIYASFYNKEKNRVGYVFRNRFLSEPIMNEKHLYNCVPYIHLNPVEAGIVNYPESYIYSSYNDFINQKGIATSSVLIKLFGCPNNYLNFFKFLHTGIQAEMEFKNDEKKLDIDESRKIIKSILNENNIENLKLENANIQNKIIQQLIQRRVAISHIEKLLNIDHRKVRKVLSKLC